MGMLASMACWKTFFVWSASARACMWGFVLGVRRVHGRTPGTSTADAVRTRTDDPRSGHDGRCVLPPIRTFTVGPGVSPGQPAAGCGRVADCHRRLGISPTPEHACVSLPVCTRRSRRSPVGPITCGEGRASPRGGTGLLRKVARRGSWARLHFAIVDGADDRGSLLVFPDVDGGVRDARQGSFALELHAERAAGPRIDDDSPPVGHASSLTGLQGSPPCPLGPT